MFPLVYFSTYFVEYQFPVVTTSKETSEPNIMATEVMRVASKKVVNGGEVTTGLILGARKSQP